MIKVSAPGKAHLIGEHAVVGGEPAIIGAIGRRLYMEISPSNLVRYRDERFGSNESWTTADVKAESNRAHALWQECADIKPKPDYTRLGRAMKADGFEGYIKSAIGIVLDRYGLRDGVEVVVLNAGGLPPGSGLGSSAALAVCLARGIPEVYGIVTNLSDVNDIAFSIEKLIHGTPSGGDNTASLYGGLIWFRKAQPSNEILSLRSDVPYPLENFALVYTGRPEQTTLEMVQGVANKPEFYKRSRFRAIGEGTTLMLDALRRKDYAGVRDIMNFAQENLADLGVSTPTIDRIVEAVQKIGGGAKLVGAGGGGMMLCQHDDKEALLKTIRDLGFDPLDADFGVDGVGLGD